jgi:hypothetical protein
MQGHRKIEIFEKTLLPTHLELSSNYKKETRKPTLFYHNLVPCLQLQHLAGIQYRLATMLLFRGRTQ